MKTENTSPDARPAAEAGKTIELTLNGFHGYITHRVRAKFTTLEDGRYAVRISPSAARKFACRMSDCRCGEGVPEEFECDDLDFETASVELTGNYPQH